MGLPVSAVPSSSNLQFVDSWVTASPKRKIKKENKINERAARTIQTHPCLTRVNFDWTGLMYRRAYRLDGRINR